MVLAALVLVVAGFAFWRHWDTVNGRFQQASSSISDHRGSVLARYQDGPDPGDELRLSQSIASRLVFTGTTEWIEDMTVEEDDTGFGVDDNRKGVALGDKKGPRLHCHGSVVSTLVAVDTRGAVCVAAELVGVDKSILAEQVISSSLTEAKAVERAISELAASSVTVGASEALVQAFLAQEAQQYALAEMPPGGVAESSMLRRRPLWRVQSGRCCAGGGTVLPAMLMKKWTLKPAVRGLAGSDDERDCNLCDSESSCCISAWACVACCVGAAGEQLDASALKRRGLHAGVLAARPARRQTRMRLEQCARLCDVTSAATWHENQYR